MERSSCGYFRYPAPARLPPHLVQAQFRVAITCGMFVKRLPLLYYEYSRLKLNQHNMPHARSSCVLVTLESSPHALAACFIAGVWTSSGDTPSSYGSRCLKASFNTPSVSLLVFYNACDTRAFVRGLRGHLSGGSKRDRSSAGSDAARGHRAHLGHGKVSAEQWWGAPPRHGAAHQRRGGGEDQVSACSSRGLLGGGPIGVRG